MIKLIVSDMDGTLLDNNGKLPKDFFEVLAELNKRNIKFIVASGRPYNTLNENFKPISDELYFICDNGAFIVENGKICSVSIIDKEKIRAVVQAASNIPNVHVLLCGVKSAYHMDIPDVFINEIRKYYVNTTIVTDLSDIDDDIFKITICDPLLSFENSFKVLDPLFKNDLLVVPSGNHWVDITNLDITKGAALEQIQKRDNITSDETMVFGDYFNDVSMLSKAHYSFIMENAIDEMKQYGNYIAKSNMENGVMEAIREYVLINNSYNH